MTPNPATMNVYGFDHPLKDELEAVIGLALDIHRARDCLRLT